MVLCAVEDARPVAICTVMLPEEFAETVSLAGLNAQEELAGSELHANVKVPLDPLIGVRATTKPAVCPLATVWLDWPWVEIEKSKPIPASAT
jgi:hypothetical protein